MSDPDADLRAVESVEDDNRAAGLLARKMAAKARSLRVEGHELLLDAQAEADRLRRCVTRLREALGRLKRRMIAATPENAAWIDSVFSEELAEAAPGWRCTTCGTSVADPEKHWCRAEDAPDV